MLTKLMGSLHRVFNRDPQPVAVVSIAYAGGSCLLEIADLRLTAKPADGGTSIDIDLAQITISDLVAAIDAVAGYSASLLVASYGDHLARGLVESRRQQIGSGENPDLHLRYPANPLWAEMQTYAWALDEQTEQRRLAEKQLYPNSSTGSWLEYWANDHFGIPRNVGESDAAYAQRFVNELLRANQNNVALEIILKEAMGIEAVIRDTWPNRAELPPEDQAKAAGTFLFDMSIPNELSPEDAQNLIDNAQALVRRYKASGKDFLFTVLRKLVQVSETQAMAEALAVAIIATFEETFVPGPIYFDAAWICGTPGLVCGNNDAIKEQVFIKVLDAADDSVVSRQLYGG